MPSMDHSDWRDDGECLTADPELFFPVGDKGLAKEQVEDAKRICAPCVVRLTCLRWALDTGQEHGVWGGLSEAERRGLKRRPGTAGVAA